MSLNEVKRMATSMETMPDILGIIFCILLGMIVAFIVSIGKNGLRIPYKEGDRWFLGSFNELAAGGVLGLVVSISTEAVIQLGIPDFVMLLPGPAIIVICCVSGIFIYDWKLKPKTDEETVIRVLTDQIDNLSVEKSRLEEKLEEIEMATAVEKTIDEIPEIPDPEPVEEEVLTEPEEEIVEGDPEAVVEKPLPQSIVIVEPKPLEPVVELINEPELLKNSEEPKDETI